MKNFKNVIKKQSRVLSLLCIGVLSSLLLSSCQKERIVASSSISSVEHYITDFTGIEIEGAFTAEVVMDTEESVVLEVNDNLHSYIEVYKENNILVVRFKNNVSVTGSQTHLVVHVSAKSLSKLEASGASKFNLNNSINGSNLNIELSGASKLNGEIYYTNVDANLSGASQMIINGTANRLTIDGSGASKMEYYDFITEDFIADLSGASNCYLTVNSSLSVKASGASNVYYKGTGIISYMELSGASEIINMN